MKYPVLTPVLLLVFQFSCYTGFAQSPYELKVDASRTIAAIQPTMYGIFFEDINFAADGGLYAEMVKNRGFEFTMPMMGWEQLNSDRHSLNLNSGRATVIQQTGHPANRNFLRVMVNNGERFALLNEGFRGMGVQAGARYQLSLNAKPVKGQIETITFTLLDEQENILGQTSVRPDKDTWSTYEASLQATATAERAKLKITFIGQGEIDLDMISLFPADTWKGRKKGLRKDLVQLLADMDPGFLRFPGGCIVEGRTLARRYQWKKTVGPVEDRTLLVNRWNTEFAHRPTPDYYQSFGLGFFEYFQLAEDIGAEPMPILGCGMACQFNTGELVPMDELGPYIEDALDLIEFANGPVDSDWGKVRAAMGHPLPFNMKYIGIGNEQWGPAYIERYVAFEKAIMEKYPDIIIISGSGPFPDGEHFEYGMAELTKLAAPIVDEHYYRSPEWFLENADRYDSYNREGPRIFAGEYAAQSVAIASPENKNNWQCALAEAAFMTGLERNADLVVMTSYAPLMAHADGWQWTPDLIWFNNLESYGTANYYVQKLFATNRGTDLITISHQGQKVIGQDKLYASAVLDTQNQTIIVKVVNVESEAREVSLAFEGQKTGSTATVLSLHSSDLAAENNFAQPLHISPVVSQLNLKDKHLQAVVPAQALVVYQIPLSK